MLQTHKTIGTLALLIEWEDAGVDRLHGAAQAVHYIRSLLWELPDASFDAAFSNQ